MDKRYRCIRIKEIGKPLSKEEVLLLKRNYPIIYDDLVRYEVGPGAKDGSVIVYDVGDTEIIDIFALDGTKEMDEAFNKELFMETMLELKGHLTFGEFDEGRIYKIECDSMELMTPENWDYIIETVKEVKGEGSIM